MSSEALKIDEGRIAEAAFNKEPFSCTSNEDDSASTLYYRPPSIECMSSEALKIDEGRAEPAKESFSCTSNGAHQYDSASTLGILSTRWSTLQQVDTECLPIDNSESTCTRGATDQQDVGDAANSSSALDYPSESEMDYTNEGYQQEDASSQHSFHRVPTPPAYPKPPGYHVRGVISCQSSLRQIKEDCLSDFSKEFVSPLAVHTAVLPYQSQRTRLGLKKNVELTPHEQEQYYEERLKESRADLAEKEEEIRKSLLDLLPPKRTLDEFYAAETEGNQVPASTPVASSTASETRLETEKVS